MTQELTDNRVFSSAIEYATMQDVKAQSIAVVHFQKKLYADGQLLGVEEDIHVRITNAGVIVTRRKPRVQGERPQSDNGQIGQPITVMLANAYDNFQRTDTEISALMSAYVLPIYA